MASSFEILSKLPKYVIEIGVFSDTSNRPKQELSSGVTNAELMFIHENGSPLKNIPARPVLQMTIDWAKKERLDKVIEKALTVFIESGGNEEAYKRELNKFCIELENYAKRLIYSNDGRLEPNAPSTAKAKWRKEKHKKSEKWQYPEGNHPLFDTGELARSIKCRAIKI